jgi:hypothetical protein
MHKNLSIFSFKMPKALLLCLFIILVQAYCFKLDTQEVNNTYNKAIELANIDFLYTGDSRTGTAIDHDYLNKTSDKKHYNYSLGGSNYLIQYIYLKRLIKSNVKIKNSYISISKYHLSKVSDNTEYLSYMYSGISFLEYLELYKDLPLNGKLAYFKGKIFPLVIKLKKKSVASYKESKKTIVYNGYFHDDKKIDSINTKYMIKMIDILKENNINSTLYYCPVPETKANYAKDNEIYKDVNLLISNIQKSRKFTYLKDIPVFPDIYFDDPVHINNKYKEVVSKYLFL